MTPSQAKSLALYGMSHRRLTAARTSLDNLLSVQCSNGNWNFDPYFHGMANGMILSRSLITGETPEFLSAPGQWLRDREITVEVSQTGRAKSKIVPGKLFNRLTVLREVEPTRRGAKQKLHRNVECRCVCGAEGIYQWTNVKSGITRSCGCLQREAAKAHADSRRLGKGEAAINAVVGRYRHQAKKRGLVFELTRDQALSLFRQNCHYCGLPPSNIYNKKVFGSFVYSGIDRLENSEGYSIGNCVPCCSTCNDAKGTMSASEFERFVRRLTENFPWRAEVVTRE